MQDFFCKLCSMYSLDRKQQRDSFSLETNDQSILDQNMPGRSEIHKSKVFMSVWSDHYFGELNGKQIKLKVTKYADIGMTYLYWVQKVQL